MNSKISMVLLRIARISPYIPLVNRYIGILRNTVKFGGAALVNCSIKIHGQGNRIEFSDGVWRNCRIAIHGNHNVIHMEHNVRGKDVDICIEDDNNKVIVGEDTYFAGKIHLACTEGRKIQIGSDCLFSSDIVIRTGDSHSIVDTKGNRLNRAKDVLIGDHVWMAHRVLVNKGAYVASHCIVGTGAIVTKEFGEQNSVIAGIPAAIIKRDVDWDARRL